MRQWKDAGRAGRDSEAELWKRFRDAQDKFFAARTEVFAAKETRASLARPRQGAAPGRGAGAAAGHRLARRAAALRSIQERWEQAGPVPRESREQLEQGLRKVEDAVRRAEDAQWKRSNPEALARAEATVSQLRTAIDRSRTSSPGPERDDARPSARPRRRSPPGVPGWSRPSAPWPSSPAEAFPPCLVSYRLGVCLAVARRGGGGTPRPA